MVLGGLASVDMLDRLAEFAADLPNSIAARRERETPRVVVARGGEHAVLCGAAALAVSGVLSPRFGRMFTGEHERDILDGGGIAA